MPRVRVLPLPDQPEGERYRTPFVLVIDRFKSDPRLEAEPWPDYVARMKAEARELGAEGAILWPGQDDEIELED